QSRVLDPRSSQHEPPPTELHPLSLHDALPISTPPTPAPPCRPATSRSCSPPTTAPHSSSVTRRSPTPSCTPGPTGSPARSSRARSEEHTSELQSRSDLVCRLLLEKKKQKYPVS